MTDYRPPRHEDYIPIVKAMIPFCDGEDLRLRCGLLLMRDRAIASKPNTVEPTWQLLDIVQRESEEAAFRTMSLDDLREIRRLCIAVVMAANGFNQFYQPSLPVGEEPKDGGAGA
jgi:hypothetical protein